MTEPNSPSNRKSKRKKQVEGMVPLKGTTIELPSISITPRQQVFQGISSTRVSQSNFFKSNEKTTETSKKRKEIGQSTSQLHKFAMSALGKKKFERKR